MLRADDGRDQSQKSAGFLPLAKDLTVFSEPWMREAELLDHLWYQGFLLENSCTQYKSKPTEEAQPHPVLSVSGRGGVYLCL